MTHYIRCYPEYSRGVYHNLAYTFLKREHLPHWEIYLWTFPIGKWGTDFLLWKSRAAKRVQPHPRHMTPRHVPSHTATHVISHHKVALQWVRVGLPCEGRFCGAEKKVRRKFAEESEITYTMTAVEGGLVACFALRVVGALQYLYF